MRVKPRKVFGILFIFFLSVKVLHHGPLEVEQVGTWQLETSSCFTSILFLFCIFCSKSFVFELYLVLCGPDNRFVCLVVSVLVTF